MSALFSEKLGASGVNSYGICSFDYDLRVSAEPGGAG
jgi:hypothetical protein